MDEPYIPDIKDNNLLATLDKGFLIHEQAGELGGEILFRVPEYVTPLPPDEPGMIPMYLLAVREFNWLPDTVWVLSNNNTAYEFAYSLKIKSYILVSTTDMTYQDFLQDR